MKLKLALVPALASLTLLSASPAHTADELRVIYPAGSAVEYEVRQWSTTKAGKASMTMDGESAPPHLIDGLKASIPTEREDELVRFTTWLDAVEDGRPVGGRRRFGELSRKQVVGGEESEEEGALVGRTLLLTAADGDEVVARLAQGEKGPKLDEVQLANHRLVLELERYLPGRAVAVGDTWDLDEAAVREILGIDRSGPAYFESESSEEEDAMESVMRERCKVSGTVEYERREKVEGVVCAVLLISLRTEVGEVEVDPSTMDLEEEGLEITATMSAFMEGEERLWFAIEAGRPLRSKAEWKGEMTFDALMSNDELGVEVEISTTADMRGGFEHRWTF
jgi:hypothetical protein